MQEAGLEENTQATRWRLKSDKYENIESLVIVVGERGEPTMKK
jgi:hypothetical protein